MYLIIRNELFLITNFLLLFVAINCDIYQDDYDQPKQPVYYGQFGDSIESSDDDGEFIPFQKFKSQKSQQSRPPRRQVHGDTQDEFGLTAMGRSLFEGVTRFGKGVIGMTDVTEDMEDKSQRRFTGEPTNYGSLSDEYLAPNDRPLVYYAMFGDSPRPSGRDGGFKEFGELKKEPRQRPVYEEEDGQKEFGLKAMGRTVVEGVTRFGKGLIGMQDVSEDLEDQSQQKFTGETSNYRSVPEEYPFDDQYDFGRGSTRINSPSFESYQDEDYEERSPYQSYKQSDYWNDRSSSSERSNGKGVITRTAIRRGGGRGWGFGNRGGQTNGYRYRYSY